MGETSKKLSRESPGRPLRNVMSKQLCACLLVQPKIDLFCDPRAGIFLVNLSQHAHTYRGRLA